MGIGDSTADNGVYTMTNLKTATGIADDRLSAHHPSGAGNNTSFGDFVLSVLGYEETVSPPNWTRLLRPGAVNGSATDANGSYDTQDPPWYLFDNIDQLSATTSDTFTVRVEMLSPGEHFPEMIAKNSPGGIEITDPDVNVNLLSKDIITSSGNEIAVDFKFEMTGYASNIQIGLTWKGNLNTNGDNVGKSSTDGEGNSLPEDAGLAFRTQEVDDGTPLIENFHVWVKDDGTDVHFDFNVDSNDNNLGEGFVVYDPDSRVNAIFEMYDAIPDTNSPYATDEEPDFLSQNQPLQVVSDFVESEGSRSKTYYCVITDQADNNVDVVQVTISENDTGTWGSTESCYSYSSPRDRTPGTESNPYQLTFDGAC